MICREKYLWVNRSHCWRLFVVVCRLKGANKACQAVASAEKKKFVNAMSASAEIEKILFKIQELKEIALSFCI